MVGVKMIYMTKRYYVFRLLLFFFIYRCCMYATKGYKIIIILPSSCIEQLLEKSKILDKRSRLLTNTKAKDKNFLGVRTTFLSS